MQTKLVGSRNATLPAPGTNRFFRYTTVYRCPAVCSVCRPLRRCHRPLSVYQAAQDKVLPHDVSNVQCLLWPCLTDTEIHWYSVSGSNVVNHLIIFAVNRCLLTVCVESFTLDMPVLTCPFQWCYCAGSCFGTYTVMYTILP